MPRFLLGFSVRGTFLPILPSEVLLGLGGAAERVVLFRDEVFQAQGHSAVCLAVIFAEHLRPYGCRLSVIRLQVERGQRDDQTQERRQSRGNEVGDASVVQRHFARMSCSADSANRALHENANRRF